MKHVIAKYLITKAVDDGRPLPAWLARVVSADAVLRQFELDQRQLIDRLRSDSNAWAVAKKPVTTVEPPRIQGSERTGKWAPVALAACACSLVGAMLYFGSQPQSANSPIATAEQSPPAGTKDLEEALTIGRELMGGIANDFDSYSSMVPISSPNEIGKLTKNYVQEAGSIFGRGLALLDQSNR